MDQPTGQSYSGDVHNFYPSKDIMNTNDIKGSKPGHLTHQRNVDKNQILGEYIKRQPEHKQRHENYGYKIRNPLFQDFYYKDLTSNQSAVYPQTANSGNNSEYFYKQNGQNYPQTAKNVYGKDFGSINSKSSQQLPKYNVKVENQENLGTLYNSKPLRYQSGNQMQQKNDYPYPRSPVDIRPPISTASRVNVLSQDLNSLQQSYAQNGNGNGKQSQSLKSASKQFRNEEQVSRGNIFSQQKNQDQAPDQRMKKIEENQRKYYPLQRQYENQPISPGLQQQFHGVQSNSARQEAPNIKRDIAKAQYKNISNDHIYQKENQFKSARNYSENAPKPQGTDFNEIYNENYGYKNVQNRIIGNNESRHIIRSKHIYNQADDFVTQPYITPKPMQSSHVFEPTYYEKNKSKNDLQGRSWKPLNIISGKRHQQYTSRMDNPAWNWKLYDRDQFSQWNDQKKHYKTLVREKNLFSQQRPEFATCNQEYGQK